MTDRELLELAAFAVGKKGTYHLGWLSGIVGGGINASDCPWNPLDDDATAMRLAAKLDMCVGFSVREVFVHTAYSDHPYEVDIGEKITSDKNYAMRRAITRAAAEIGKQMKARNEQSNHS